MKKSVLALLILASASLGASALPSNSNLVASCQNVSGRSLQVYKIGDIYKFRLDAGQKHLALLESKDNANVFLKMVNYQREVDLHIDFYKPGTLTNSTTVVEVILDDQNDLPSYLEFTQDQCSVFEANVFDP
jgi:hypothetical protein